MIFKLEKYQEFIEFIKEFSTNKEDLPLIIAVTKTQPIPVIKEAINAGVRLFGENRVQEALLKFKDLKGEYKDLKLHMIGSLQSNKVKKALEIFDYFHTLDRESLANEFSKHHELVAGKSFLIQVNTGHESQKSGILPSVSNEFIRHCINDLKLNVVGLMCLPPIIDDPAEHFLILKDIALKNNLKHLSMGMSNDYKIALKCGATYIRVGTHFFGKRNTINL
jgi:hypothetical protein